MISSPPSLPPRPRSLLRALRLPALVLGLGLALSACGDGASSDLRAAQVPSVVLQDALDVMLRAPSEGAAEAYLASLPAPLERVRRPVANVHHPRTSDVLETLAFDGLALGVYRVSATGASFPVTVTVTSPAHRTADGLGVGLTRAEVRAALGAPATADGSWHYDRLEAGSAPHALDLTFAGDVVVRLRWTAYLD